MTKEQIIEGNRIIAEFFGKTYKDDIDNGEFGYLYPTNGNFGRRLMPINMEYHKSWDWLMPVVEKIETLTNKAGGLEVYISYNTCIIYGNLQDSYFNDVTETSKILSVWLACVNFIKWCNESKETR